MTKDLLLVPDSDQAKDHVCRSFQACASFMRDCKKRKVTSKCHRMVFPTQSDDLCVGIYDRDKIPIYIVHAVQEIKHPKGKAFFTQRLIVKHNRAPHAIPELLDMEGHVLPHDVLHQPQPKPSEFFDTITVPHEDISGEQVPAPAHLMQIRVESAPPDAGEPAPQAAAPAPRKVREVWHAYGSPAEMNQRWSRMQARKDTDSKREAAAGANEASARSKRSTRKIT
jgi:hypothetical protein